MPKMSFTQRLKAYPTYDTSTGHGTPDEWRSMFQERLGAKVAADVLGSRNPYAVLGLTVKATWAEVRSAYRSLARMYHPDNLDTGNAEKFRSIQAAYEVLEGKQ